MDDLISRQTDCVLKEFGNCSYSETGCADCEVKEKIRNALSVYWKYKRMYADVSDTISRRAAIDAVNQYISQFDAIDVNFLDGLKEAINIVMKLPSAQPTHTTHSNTLDALDCISRQAAIELIERMKPYHQDADDIAEMIANMPSAQPEQRRGKWIKIMKTNKSETATFYTPTWICGNCKTEYDGAIANSIIKFCYNCGADMRGERDG